MSRPRMNLNLFMLPAGHHFAAWRLPDMRLDAVLDIGYYEQLARTAERGKFDSVFLADGGALSDSSQFNALSGFDPILVLTALARATSRIGLIATLSTTFSHPFDVARRFSSLDHLSAGRAGWNIVTTWDAAAAANYGLTGLPANARYARAREFVDVVRLLWDTWDDDAIVNDKARGIFFDATKVHRIDFQGEQFRVAGPLVCPRSPQGHPVLVQAGSSEDGRDFAARYADAIFTAQETMEGCRAFSDDVRRRATLAGRDPQSIRVLPGFSALIGSTEAEARAMERQLFEVGGIDYGLRMLARILGKPDVLHMPLDGPLPDEILDGADGALGWQSRARIAIEIARNEKLTIRQLVRRLDAGRGHHVFVGIPEQAADEMELWFRSGAADGFNVMPQSFPDGLEIFVDHVIPELQRRKLFRDDYDGITLRDQYGLKRPDSSSRTTRA